MKTISTLFFILLFITENLQSQIQPCQFDEIISSSITSEVENTIQKGSQIRSINYRDDDSIKYIPVVVHIIHIGGTENISDEQVKSQIRILNEDYGRIEGTRGEGIGVDTKVRFFLANKDPKGRCTNGIVRVQSNLSRHQTYQRALLKELSFWDNERYMNIYVVKTISGNVAGYSSFPGGPADEDGMVVQNNYFGTIGTANKFLGRTTTHEVGHWMGLYHTFNNACGSDVCDDGDYVCDTPPAATPNYNCRTVNTCANDQPDENDNKENYMDYTPGSCKNMFTRGQKMRIQSSLHEIRKKIWSKENLEFVGYDSVSNSCPVYADFVSLTRDICIGNTIGLIDKSLNNASTWSWEFPGGSPGTSTLKNPVVTYEETGSYDVKLKVTAGQIKDSIVFMDYIQVSEPGIGDALSFEEDFDEGLYPPEQIEINNFDGGITWELDSAASTSGKYSFRINNLINTNYGSSDELLLPELNLNSGHPDSNLYMSFKWAYARSDPSFSDEMIVLLSSDCGTNYRRIFYKKGNSLTTGPTQTTPFIPDYSQWKSAFIKLDRYSEATFVQIKIVNVTDGGNNLYIDDIYVGDGGGLVSVNNDFTPFRVAQLLQNPVSDKIIIQLKDHDSVKMTIKLVDMTGVIVYAEDRDMDKNLDKYEIEAERLRTGLYILEIKIGSKYQTMKVMVQH